MPVRHDYVCNICSAVRTDATAPPLCCGSEMVILWTAPPRSHIGLHPSERPVVYFNPATGKHATPMRADVPMPDRYRAWGYERREFTSVHELDAFCKANNLVHHKSHYDNSGRAYDDDE
jgi:hypothetical protein